MTQDTKTNFDQSKAKKNRKRMFLILISVVLIAGLSYGAYYYIIGSKYVKTDNAYVGAEIAQVTPAVGGTIKEIKYNDTDRVKAGDLLVVIDDTDCQLVLANAQTDLAKAQVDFNRTKIDYDRRISLEKSGSVSGEEVTNAKNAFKAAEASLQGAKVRVEQAKIDLQRTLVKSPVDGVIAKRQVQLGQRVQIGVPLMSVVPLDKVHVDANFKEVQLRKVRLGQPVTLKSDLYGSSVLFHGKVVGIAGGTGSAFAVIPAQNATGNWIKVIQRLPVRIELNSEELRQHPLQVGLSMEVSIDVSNAL